MAARTVLNIVNLANGITASRIALSPVFFLVFFIPLWTGELATTSIVLMWLLFVWIECSDIADGEVARRTDTVTDVGKVLDPFADVFIRLTYFVCLLLGNLMPVWAFLIIMYREIGILFVRMLMYRKGVALAARKGGKLKTVMYSVAAGAGILLSTFNRIGVYEPESTFGLTSPFPVTDAPAYIVALAVVATVMYLVAAVASVMSFLDYVHVFRQSNSET